MKPSREFPFQRAVRSLLLPIVVATVGTGPLCFGQAAAPVQLTVRYVKAAIGSITNQANVNFVAEYLAKAGLEDVSNPAFEESKFSRFSVKDPG